MSAESWKGEFYFIEAEELAKDQYTDLDRLQHAELKWSGFLPENLAKHNLIKPPITLEAETCSLCCRYLCLACVVKKVTGESCIQEYEKSQTGNPVFILDLIKKVRDGIT